MRASYISVIGDGCATKEACRIGLSEYFFLFSESNYENKGRAGSRHAYVTHSGGWALLFVVLSTLYVPRLARDIFDSSIAQLVTTARSS